MGYLIVTDLTTGKTELLGDREQYEKEEGIPNKERPQSKLDEIDKLGE